MFNFMSITAVSRDGKDALFMKYIPIELSKQYKYKAIPGIIVNMFPLIFNLVVFKYFIPQLSCIFLFEVFLLIIPILYC